MKPICITCKADCHNAGTTSGIVDCSQHKPGRILTNADRIRAVSDEQMSKDLLNMMMELCEDGAPCEEFALDWFRRPAEEG